MEPPSVWVFQKARNAVRQLEAMGYHVTLEQAS
jgi:hypothetical protein